MPSPLLNRILHRRLAPASRRRNRAPVPVLDRVQRLEDRALLSGVGIEQPGATQAPDLAAFAQSLSDEGVVFYGAAWCPHCTDQKELFEDGAHYLPFVEVTNPDRTLNQVGIDNNISSFPTWVFPDGSPEGRRLTGVQTLETLSAESGIAIPNSAVPCFVELPDVTVLGGSPLMVGIDGYDPNNDALTYTVTSDDPLVSAELFSGNRSMLVDVAGYGNMLFELFENRVPRATNRFIQLAQGNFFDGIIFHRVINNFVIQGGDPTGTGGGGSTLGDFDDQFDVDLQHNSTGLLSMAKSTDDTNDSQFFVTEGPARHLDFNHSIFGKLVEGEANRAAISDTAVGAGDRPVFNVTMNTVDIIDDTENAVLMLSAAEGASGSANITVTVTDPEGNSFQQTFAVTVTPDIVNGAPFLRDIPDYHLASGEDFTIELSSVDAEGDPVTYGVDTNLGDQNGLVAIEGNSITLFTDPDTQGQFSIAVAVVATNGSDTTDPIDEQIITITVTSADPVVTVTAIDSIADEDGLDGGSIQFEAATIPLVLRDDFDGSALDLDVWNLAEPGPSSVVGRTQLQTVQAPEVSGGVVRLRVDSFNPFSPGDSFLGTSIASDSVFTINQGLVFETRARLVDEGLNPLNRGLAASFFSFGLDEDARDEISLDLTSNDALDSNERVRTSVSNDEAIGLSAAAAFASAAGVDVTSFNTYRIEWLPGGVEWYVNDVLVRSETGTVPDDPMNVGLQFFAPDSGFAEAFDAGTAPAANAGANQTWFLEVDFVELRRPQPDITIGISSVGSATNGNDFATVASTIEIDGNVGSVTVPITVLQDIIAERTETATLSIDAGAGYSVGVLNSATVNIADDDPLPDSVEVEVALVVDQTATDPDGETDAAPDSEEWVDEWDEFFVEIWAQVPLSEGYGVLTASADLTYNTAYFTATDVTFGTPFTTGQAFSIDDGSGRVNGITATADRNDAGGNRFVLLARVAFASVGTDQVLLNSQAGYATPFNDLNVTIENVSVTIADVGAVTSVIGTSPQTEVWPVIFDLDDSHTLGFGDLPIFAGLFNVSTETTADAFKADFDHSGETGFGDVTVLAGNFNRSRDDTGRQFYPVGFPENWGAAGLQATLSADGTDAVADPSATLTEDVELADLADAAVERLRDAGLSDSAASELDNVTIEFADLPGRQLGLAIDGRIVVDIDGAGLGWFIDATPLDSVEFDSQGRAVQASASNRYDLLTVIAHELGHLLSLDHGDAGSLMDDTLNPGERRLSDLDEQFSESLELLDD